MVGYLIFSLAILGLIVAFYYSRVVLSIPIDKSAQTKEERVKLKQIHKAIADGASAFLSQEYKYMSIFMVVFAGVILLLVGNAYDSYLQGGLTAIAFLIGALMSILSGFIGMKIATAGNVRTATGAKESLAKAFSVALHSGAVMGFALTALALIGLMVTYLLIHLIMPPSSTSALVMELLAGFGLGGSSMALFGRVGGGIYTKAADVGADLVGKVEKGIPEDDPRNPAVIADNVGDNVGDVAGMGSDLFGSVAESTCAALVIGAVAFTTNLGAVLFPVLISALGIPISLLTLALVRVRTEGDVGQAFKKMLLLSTVLMAIIVYFANEFFMPESYQILGQTYSKIGIYVCYMAGLISGLAIGLVTEYFTSHSYQPVRELAKSCETGAATNIIFGIALGFKSAGISVLALVVSIFVPYYFGGMYGVAISALGMLGTLVIALTIDAYGPVADNAGGIAEMAGLGPEIREKTDILDAAGNTTAAIGKGLAIGSAILTSLALFFAFITRAAEFSGSSAEGTSNFASNSVSLMNPFVLGGLFLGTILPFLFSAMTMKSVGRAAYDMIAEVRRQFRAQPGIMLGKVMPDYKRCIAISTKAALREMIAPALLILLTPLVVGFLFGISALAATLMGSLLVSAGLAIMQTNSGGAWDNAKKYIEKGFLGGKKSEPHKAAVVGDTVGDPFKDTSGPSLNILMKLSAILSLVFVPFFAKYGGILVKLLGN